ncbi:hypothetical protein RJT34_20532 [Clitoria ternatea]|uniref:Vegetative cell wall protein gp1-like n=1 Tax=Clitoria ternatea TaxID=43366 RepID=A0AAN9ITB1_CLITE
MRIESDSLPFFLFLSFFIRELTMANPPPVRPWFRLASIRSTPAPAPAPAPTPTPAPETRPVLPLPAFRTASAPSSPHIQPTHQPQEKTVPSPPQPQPQPHRGISTSLPTSPVQKAALTSSEKTTRGRVPSPTHSPKAITKQQPDRSPMHSPTQNAVPPLSPLTLPPSQFKAQPNIPPEAEPKTVLVQKTVDKPKPWHNGNGTAEFHRETQTRGGHHGKHHAEKGVQKKISDSEESGTRVITIAGENRGAYMELTQSPKKHEGKYLHKKENAEWNEGSSAEEGNVQKKDNKSQKGRSSSSSSFPMAAYMNSNVQCVNNSLLFHTSCSHHDPGVRLSLSKKPLSQGYHLKEQLDGHTT